MTSVSLAGSRGHRELKDVRYSDPQWHDIYTDFQ